jgi:hypothetical protein
MGVRRSGAVASTRAHERWRADRGRGVHAPGASVLDTYKVPMATKIASTIRRTTTVPIPMRSGSR